MAKYLLLSVWPSPVVALNRAVAVSMVDGPAAGLAALDTIAEDPHLANYPYLASTRADLLRRLGQTQQAAQAYQAALSLATNTTERDFLAWRLAEVIDQPIDQPNDLDR